MKLGLMQPYFFPYLGYFDLIHRTDRWIVFDTAQYIRRGWVNRNRMLHPQEGWQFIIAETQKASRETSIAEIRLANHSDWRTKIIRQLEHYKKSAPFYRQTMDLLQSTLDQPAETVNELNVHGLKSSCDYLGISMNFELLSRMDVTLEPIEEPGDWALRLCEQLSADEYLNPPGGAALYDAAKFQRSGIRLKIQQFENMTYPTGKFAFEPGLSILDVMMWNSPEAIRDYLEQSARQPGEQE